MKTKREEQITKALVTNGFEYKGVFYRVLTTRSLLILENFNSAYIYGGKQLRGLMDLLYVSSHDPRELESIKPEEWDDVIFEYAETLTPEDLKELGRLATEYNESHAATMVEVRDDSTKK